MLNKLTTYTYVVLIAVLVILLSWFIYRGHKIDSLQKELNTTNENMSVLAKDLANKQQAALERDKAYKEIERIKNEKDSELQKVTETGKAWLLGTIPADVDSTIPY